MKTDIIVISGMHCTSCALSIDFELEDTPGVENVHTKYAQQHVEITYDSTKITLLEIEKIITNLGYAIVKN